MGFATFNYSILVKGESTDDQSVCAYFFILLMIWHPRLHIFFDAFSHFYIVAFYSSGFNFREFFFHGFVVLDSGQIFHKIVDKVGKISIVISHVFDDQKQGKKHI